MGNLTNYAENKLIDHVLGEAGETYTGPSSVFVALCTADPGETATGSTLTEPSGGAYSRMEVLFGVAADRATANTTSIAFNTATVGWGTISHFAICDALVTGNALAYGVLAASKRVLVDGEFSVALGDLDLSFNSGAISDYLANELLDHMFRNEAYSQPASIFVALCTATPVDGDNGATISEPSGGSYARKEVNAWATASGGATENDSDFQFATSTATLGTLSHFALVDDLTNGNMLFFGALGTATPFTTGDYAKVLAGELVVTLD
jgi:hypothetical protein